MINLKVEEKDGQYNLSIVLGKTANSDLNISGDKIIIGGLTIGEALELMAGLSSQLLVNIRKMIRGEA